ncbi:uncharacterized protein LOC115968801 [Quercus lobata]|uniref:Bromodomain associated domain-containing protein n=1 Tax=Quercus lobata TaxID=97700 RepID=A0A7N2MYX3_QUELO|nr:uncharacterized protein LOC115968801 [Quercus lobata]
MKAKPPSKPKTHLHLHQEEPQNPSGFSFAIARIAVSQICQSVGYKATQLSALNALTVVATKYLEAIAKSASSLANTSNRTQSNLLDLTLALHHLVTLHTSTLFSISSSGGIIRELADFVSFHDEIPFAKPIPRPQITSIPSRASSSCSCSSSFSHVPKWLPKFPDSVISCSVNERKCGERLWEDSVLGGGGIETECSTSTSDVIEQEKLKEGKLELDLERTGKVRFRITTTRGRGGGGGGRGLRRVCREEKGVCWNHHNHHYNNKNITNNSTNDDDVLDDDGDDQSNGIFYDEGLKKSGLKRKRR